MRGLAVRLFDDPNHAQTKLAALTAGQALEQEKHEMRLQTSTDSLTKVHARKCSLLEAWVSQSFLSTTVTRSLRCPGGLCRPRA